MKPYTGPRPTVVAAFAQQAIKSGDTLTGTLRLVRTTHPNGTRIEAYQIVSKPRTMPADNEFCPPGKVARTFYLFAGNIAARQQSQCGCQPRQVGQDRSI